MNLKQKITNHTFDMPNGTDIYLFGSSLTSDNPNDIDILITYDKEKIGLKEAVEIRKDIEKSIFDLTGTQGEVVLLSNEEDKEVEFTKNIKTQKLKK